MHGLGHEDSQDEAVPMTEWRRRHHDSAKGFLHARQRGAVFLAAVAALTVAMPAAAGITYNVSTEPELQAAVAAVNAGVGGDTIVLAPGVYMLTDVLRLGSSMTIQGDPVLPTVLDGGNGRTFGTGGASGTLPCTVSSPCLFDIVSISAPGVQIRDLTLRNGSHGFGYSYYSFSAWGVTITGNETGVELGDSVTGHFTNSTIAGNTWYGVVGIGDLDLTNVTVSNNGWQGIAQCQGCRVRLTNSLVVANGLDCKAPVWASLNSLDSDGTCGVTTVSPAALGLGGLAANGGPTMTEAISATSPARNAGDMASCPPTDQRGVARSDGACDIGAYEYVPPAPPALLLTFSGAAGATEGVPYAGGALAATGGFGFVTYSAVGLPPGLSCDSFTGAITGTPTFPSAGNWSVTGGGSDIVGAVGQVTFDILVAPSPGADLQLTLFPIASVSPGGLVTIDASVTNAGPLDASGVQLSYSGGAAGALPVVSFVAAQGTCSPSSCALGTILVGGRVTVRLVLDPSALLAGAPPAAIDLGVLTVTEAPPDPDPTSNQVALVAAVVIPDTTPPVIFAPTLRLVVADGSVTALGALGVTALDAVDGPVVPVATSVVGPTVGGGLAQGSHTITWSATDAAGNTATAIQQVILDTPSIVYGLPMGGGTVDVSAAGGQQLSGVTVGGLSPAVPGVTFLGTTIGYTVSAPVGGTASVTFAFSPPLSVSGTLVLYKVDRVGVATQLPTTAFTSVGGASVTSVTITLTDGGSFDLDRAADGKIEDPVALGVRPLAPPPPPPGDDGDDDRDDDDDRDHHKKHRHGNRRDGGDDGRREEQR